MRMDRRFRGLPRLLGDGRLRGPLPRGADAGAGATVGAAAGAPMAEGRAASAASRSLAQQRRRRPEGPGCGW